MFKRMAFDQPILIFFNVVNYIMQLAAFTNRTYDIILPGLAEFERRPTQKWGLGERVWRFLLIFWDGVGWWNFLSYPIRRLNALESLGQTSSSNWVGSIRDSGSLGRRLTRSPSISHSLPLFLPFPSLQGGLSDLVALGRGQSEKCVLYPNRA